MDYEVAVFQLKTLTTPYLGSAANRYTFKLGLLPDLFILPFLDLPPPPSFIPPPHPWPFIVKAL